MMMKIYVCLLFILFQFQGISQVFELEQHAADTTTKEVLPYIPSVGIEFFDEIKAMNNDTLYIINFWATWCKPCVEELPAFVQLADSYLGQKVRVIMVSNDTRKLYETKLVDFTMKKGIFPYSVWMSAANPDAWINSIDEQWSGAIPATLLYKGSIGFRWFKEGETTFDELINKTVSIVNK
jgi:thiol-disulfide isomerase/thioredoxin